MLLQIGAARRLLDQDPAAASQLLRSSETLGRKAAGDLDVALSLMGNEQVPESRGLDELPALVSTLHDAGLPVALRIEGERGDISTLVDWSAYRIAREALTNVLRHAPGAATTVTIRYRDADIQLSVVNHSGHADGGRPHEDGRGIVGIRERAAALGGTLEVGPTPGSGFAVAATLPIRPQ
jgi:signal transduction histidine kinase